MILKRKTNNAFVLVHFGNNIKYLEYEIYFLINLNMHTKNNIVYLYSLTDTPKSFVDAISKYVYKCVPYDDNNITYNINFTSVYTSFNTLRTCNFIFSYLLFEYNKVCILESDMIIMNNIDNIFKLNTPSVHNFVSSHSYFNNPVNKPYIVTKNKEEMLEKCVITSDFYVSQTEINGGVMLIKPDQKMFNKYLKNLKIIIEKGCKYPNESLFVYTNPTFYNIPIKYNFTHYILKNFITKSDILKKSLKEEGLLPEQNNVILYHFNETPYKYLEIIKDKWLEENKNDKKIMKKYKYYVIPVKYFKNKIYDKYKNSVNKQLQIIIEESNINQNNNNFQINDKILSKTKTIKTSKTKTKKNK